MSDLKDLAKELVSKKKLKDGKQGLPGKDGRDGKEGKPGKDGKAGLDGKDENSLMDSLAYVKEKVQLLKANGKTRQQFLKEQREQERVQAISEMPTKSNRFVPKWLKTFTHFSTSIISI